MRIAIIGSNSFRELERVRTYIRSLTSADVIMIGDESTGIEATTVRQCGCGGIVCMQIRAPRRAQRKDAEERRDRIMFDLADKIVVWGEPHIRRSSLVAEYEEGGAVVERHEKTRAAAAEQTPPALELQCPRCRNAPLQHRPHPEGVDCQCPLADSFCAACGFRVHPELRSTVTA